MKFFKYHISAVADGIINRYFYDQEVFSDRSALKAKLVDAIDEDCGKDCEETNKKFYNLLCDIGFVMDLLVSERPENEQEETALANLLKDWPQLKKVMSQYLV